MGHNEPKWKKGGNSTSAGGSKWGFKKRKELKSVAG